MENTPSEYKNLAYGPEYKEIRDELERQLYKLEIAKLRVNAAFDVS